MRGQGNIRQGERKAKGRRRCRESRRDDARAAARMQSSHEWAKGTLITIRITIISQLDPIIMLNANAVTDGRVIGNGFSYCLHLKCVVETSTKKSHYSAAWSRHSSVLLLPVSAERVIACILSAANGTCNLRLRLLILEVHGINMHPHMSNCPKHFAAV